MQLDIDVRIKSIRIGHLQKNKRTEKKMTQVQIAKKLGVSNSCIEHKESGFRSIDLDFLKKWCNILDLEIELSLKEKKCKCVSSQSRKKNGEWICNYCGFEIPVTKDTKEITLTY